MEVGILGPLVVWKDDAEVPIGAPKQRAVLALLVLRAGELVPTERLVDELWERPPATAVKTVQVYVSQLRKALGDGVLETRPSGYLIRLEPDALDAARFERLLGRGRGTLERGDAREAAAVLREALALWRGPALAEFRYSAFARDESGRLEELRLVALESRLQADLALGRHAEVVPELETIVRDHPLRERLRELLMLAFYRAGRQAAALAVYQDARTTLVEELGLEPGQSLRQLEQAILRHDPQLDLAPATRADTSSPPAGTVTMLFTDIEGSTRLLRQLGERYGDLLSDHRRLLRAAFASNGGREMDTQGDAFFVAFPRARNAITAAVEAQRALAGHEWPGGVACRVRMGLHSGEPEVGTEGYHGLGLHRGARIAAAAHGGQIVLSSATRELIKDDLPAGVDLRDLGEQRFRDIDGPERVFQVVADGLPSEFPPLQTGGKRPRRGRAVLVAAAGLIVVTAVAAGVALEIEGSSGPAAASAAAVSADSVGAFHAGTGHLTGQISVGASPTAIAAGGGSVWVANIDADTVSRIDPVKQTTIDTIQVGNDPDGIAFGGGFTWVTNGLDGTVTQIDPATNTPVQAIPVGSGPAGVAVDSHYVWVANSNDGTVTRIDLRTDKPLAPIPVGQSADGVAIGFGSVWVTSQASGNVTRIDERTGEVIQPIEAGSGADAVAAGPDSVWVANELDSTVTRIDPVSDAVRATIPVGDGPNGIAVAGRDVWVSNGLAGSLSRIDPVRNVTVQSIRTGNQPEGVALDGGTLYAAVRASGVGHRGGTLTVLTQGGNTPTLDPAIVGINGDVEQGQLLSLTSDGLLGYRKVGGSAGTSLVPDLAVSIPPSTSGGLTYTFRVRRGIRYSNGALLRPQDFRAGLERAVMLAGQQAGYAHLVGVKQCLAAPKRPCDLSKGIVADDAAGTVTFHLTSADPNFLYSLVGASAFPVPSGTPLREESDLPGTGPYRVARFDPRHEIRLVRNRWFREWSRAAQPSGNPDVIVERFGGTADARVRSVLRGTADLATGDVPPSPPLLQSLRTQHLSELKQNPWVSTWFIALNTRVPPFDNLDARRAFNFAIDRQHLRDLTLGQGVGQLSCQILPPDFQGYAPYCPYTVAANAAGKWTAPDLGRARQLVSRSGTKGDKVIFWIPPWIHFDAASGRYVVSVLDSLGYRAQFRLPKTDPYADEDRLGLQTGFYAWGPSFAAPAGFIPPGLGCAATYQDGNVAQFCDPAIDREMTRAQALQTVDPVTANQLWARIDRQLTDQSPWVSFANGVVLEVVSTRVGNYQYNPSWGTLLDQLWVR
jgi:YVTN family beta-propeller protein